MKRAFILGAGASAFCGYPLALDLWRFVREAESVDLIAQEARTRVIAIMEGVLQVNPPEERDRVDLEKLFTLLDLAQRGTGPPELRRTDWPQTKLEVMAMISKSFMWHQHQFQAEIIYGRPRHGLYGEEPFGLGLDHDLILSVLNNWTELLTDGDTIVSFNWDILHESSLWRAGKWHFSDGYGFTARDAPKDVRSRIKMFKLHGSVNWAQSSDDDLAPEIEHKGDFFCGAVDDPGTYWKRIQDRNDGRYLILPTYHKDLSGNRLLLRVWEQARDALIDAEQWFAIGFSLNEADTAARFLLASALDQNAGLREIFVVSPDPVEWDKLCYRFGKRSRTIASRFEDWLRDHHPEDHAPRRRRARR